ncbi:MAG: hypothetical protein HXX08_11875 [Chloroflexi bacterium]|uniref:Uncharacterized protein n=1 Tax=Candidatus Chlorohelix allophototropha TaxID=3003348 RepID=A0A8T7M2D6_9CHLR|nr:hypothetical protein [Chloroflexota bacterium]WJW65938.1 hypothetical protein OZ401_001718 [Chloroflexota bacterium L227-S17]
MKDTKKLLFRFNPDAPLRQTVNFIRAQVAGQGTEKSFALTALETRKSFDESGYGLMLPLNIITNSNDTSAVIPALVYLDGSGYSERTLNQLLESIGLPEVRELVEYSLD